MKAKAKQAKQENIQNVMTELKQATNMGDQDRVYQSAKKLLLGNPAQGSPYVDRMGRC